MKHSLKIDTTDEGQEGELSLTGDMTMVAAQEIKKALLEAIGQVDKLFLDLSEVEEVDVSFVQLICAAHRECFLSGKDIFFRDKPTGSVEELLLRAGYTKQLGCPTDAKSSCLWNCGKI